MQRRDVDLNCKFIKYVFITEKIYIHIHCTNIFTSNIQFKVLSSFSITVQNKKRDKTILICVVQTLALIKHHKYMHRYIIIIYEEILHVLLSKERKMF